MNENPVAVFGFPSEWKDFHERHKLFFERLPNLKRAQEIAFLRAFTPSKISEGVVFFLGRLCGEDFFEILLLCGNGYGFGGMRLLRGMYERAVTARYLHLHPDDAKSFLDFHWVTKRKQVQAIKETFGADVLPKDKMDELEAQFRRVEGEFQVTRCKKCGAKGLNYTWSKLDLVSMAGQAGNLGKLIVPAYYFPTEEAHSTAGGILSRLEESGEGIRFKDGPGRDKADESLLAGHNILLDVLLLQKEHFGLEALAEPLGKCFQDFLDIWGRGPKEPNGEGV